MRRRRGEVAVVEPEPTGLVLPHSGEVVPLDDPLGCATALDEIRTLEARLREAKTALSRSIADEAARQGTKTLRLGDGVTAKVTVGREIVWDLDELQKLRDAGLPEERFDALVTTEVTYKVSAGEAKRIAGANPEYARIIERARDDVERAPTVSIERSQR